MVIIFKFFSYMSILIICTCGNIFFRKSVSKVYYNKEIGYSFKYPQSWKVIHESLYQSAGQECRNEPDIHPPVMLQNIETNCIISINERQCLNEIGLKGGNWICLDSYIPAKHIGFNLSDLKENKGNLPADVYNAMVEISNSFSIITKGNN